MTDAIDGSFDLLTLTADIVSAHVTHNRVAVADIAALIASVHRSLASLRRRPGQVLDGTQRPAVAIRQSIKPDYLICLEDGKKVKMLKRYIMARYQLTPDAYRAKWKLPADYPMVAPNYAAFRRTLANDMGLGKGRRT